MVVDREMTDDGPMVKKVFVWFVVAVSLLSLGGWGFSAYKDHQMDSSRFVERVAATPTPEHWVLIDEWHRDGDWLFKPRAPEAVRQFVAVGEANDVCNELDRFFGSREIESRPVARSDDPADWCGRSVDVNGGRVSIRIQPTRAWTEIPVGLEGSTVEVHLGAYGR